jgi:hypothetical protein
MSKKRADFVHGKIPVEQLTKFDFLVNLTDVKASGLRIPQTTITGQRG